MEIRTEGNLTKISLPLPFFPIEHVEILNEDLNVVWIGGFDGNEIFSGHITLQQLAVHEKEYLAVIGEYLLAKMKKQLS